MLVVVVYTKEEGSWTIDIFDFSKARPMSWRAAARLSHSLAKAELFFESQQGQIFRGFLGVLWSLFSTRTFCVKCRLCTVGFGAKSVTTAMA